MIDELLDPNFIKPVLLTVHQQMVQRIFDNGLDANDSPIGEYSEEYIKQRVKKGLGSSPKVILQFSGQMRNDYLLLEERGQFASGFTNQANADKSFWVEDTYDKEIFKLTDKEEQLLDSLLNEKVNGALS